jgi:hypothetical protein
MLASLMLGQSQREREVFRKKNVINQMKKVSSSQMITRMMRKNIIIQPDDNIKCHQPAR